MIAIEIPDNANCEPVDLRVFHDLERALPARRVRLERGPGGAAWYDVTGWMAEGRPCAAWVQKVDDSGDGTAFLLHGGDAGLRLQPAGRSAAWRLEDPAQWGAPFLIVGERDDVMMDGADG